MFITNTFAFVHLHKSGGTFVNAFLRKFFPDGRRMNWHLPRSYLPEAERALPVFGVVRNPWDYYVSWFAFQSRMPPHQRNVIYQAVTDGGALGFGPSIANLVNLGFDPIRLAAIRARLPDSFGDHGVNLTRTCLDPLPGSGLGFYSFLFNRMFARRRFGDIGGVTFARMESLRGDLLDFLPRVSVDVTAEMQDYILHSERKNVTEHAPFERYYGPASPLRALVAVRDRDVIDRFGYTFSPPDRHRLPASGADFR